MYTAADMLSQNAGQASTLPQGSRENQGRSEVSVIRRALQGHSELNEERRIALGINCVIKEGFGNLVGVGNGSPEENAQMPYQECPARQSALALLATMLQDRPQSQTHASKAHMYVPES